MKFVLFKKSLEEGAAPVYLFDGEEEYFKERGEEMLKSKFLQEPSLNYTVLQGDTLKGAQMSALIAAVQCVPFLSQKRIVKVTDFFPTEKDYAAYLKPYLENPQRDTILLIINSASPKGKTVDLRKAPNVTWVDCSRADDDTVLRWIYTQFKRAGITADTECCERIMRYCLSDMSRISGETEKLIAFASDTKKITAQDVDAVVYKDAEYKTYEMSNALGIKNYGKFMAVQNELLAKGMDETAVLNALCSYYRGMFEIILLRKSDAETAKILGMKEYGVKMNRRQAEMIGLHRVEECFRGINGALSRMKAGEISASAALQVVNLQLFFGGNINNVG